LKRIFLLKRKKLNIKDKNLKRRSLQSCQRFMDKEDKEECQKDFHKEDSLKEDLEVKEECQTSTLKLHKEETAVLHLEDQRLKKLTNLFFFLKFELFSFKFQILILIS